MAGHHDNCISGACYMKQLNNQKEDWQTKEFEDEMMKLKKMMRKKLTKYPLEKAKSGITTGALERFNGNVNKYAQKRVEFKSTHKCRVYSAVNDWNEDHSVPSHQGWRRQFCEKYGII